MAALLEECYKLVDKYGSGELVCKAQEYRDYLHRLFLENARRKCDTLVYRSLVKGLMKLSIWPGPITPSRVYKSMSSLMQNLRSAHCFALGGGRGGGKSHAYCRFTINLAVEIDCIEKHIRPTGVDDSHREHIKEQAQK